MQPDRTDTQGHLAKFRIMLVGQNDGNRAAVDGEHNGSEDLTRVRLAFRGRDLTVAIRIHQCEDLRRHIDACSEINLYADAAAFNRQTRGLKVLVQAMGCGSRGT